MIISAHCVLNKLSLDKHVNDLEKYVAIFGNQIPFFNGKRITKRYIWSHFTNKKTVNMFSSFEKRYFFHNAISFFKANTLKNNPFSEVLTSKEDRYWINKQIKKNKKFLYDPEMEVEVQLPYLSAGKPATPKNFIGADVALLNDWDLEMGLDYSNEDLLETVATGIGGTTYRQQRIFLQGYGTHVSFRLKHKGEGPAKIGNLAFHYTDGEQPG